MWRTVAVFPEPGTPTNVTNDYFFTCSSIIGKLCVSKNTSSSSFHIETSFSCISENGKLFLNN